ncbi:MAG: hypothetical protein MJZ98_00445 [Paludibacteraceae bacterium]|nr:hypothetical protein [Paludibacteraceae bacterium]
MEEKKNVQEDSVQMNAEERIAELECSAKMYQKWYYETMSKLDKSEKKLQKACEIVESLFEVAVSNANVDQTMGSLLEVLVETVKETIKPSNE